MRDHSGSFLGCHCQQEACRGKERLLLLRRDGTGRQTNGPRFAVFRDRTRHRFCRETGKGYCGEEGIEACLKELFTC